MEKWTDFEVIDKTELKWQLNGFWITIEND